MTETQLIVVLIVIILLVIVVTAIILMDVTPAKPTKDNERLDYRPTSYTNRSRANHHNYSTTGKSNYSEEDSGIVPNWLIGYALLSDTSHNSEDRDHKHVNDDGYNSSHYHSHHSNDSYPSSSNYGNDSYSSYGSDSSYSSCDSSSDD